MSARASVHTLLTADLAEDRRLGQLGFTLVRASNSLDTPTDHKFIITRWEDKRSAFGLRGQQRLTVWFHTRDQDYSDLDEAMERVKELLQEAVHVEGADGWTLTQADWRGDSQDLIDDGFRTQCRNSAYDVVSRYTTAQI